jgi:hypothetical protein
MSCATHGSMRVVTRLDMIEVRCVQERRIAPVQLPQPSIIRHFRRFQSRKYGNMFNVHSLMNSWVSGPKSSEITLEVAVICGVKSDCRHVRAHVRLCELITNEVVFTRKYFLKAVERLEDDLHVGFVRYLRSGESSFVYTVLRFL